MEEGSDRRVEEGPDTQVEEGTDTRVKEEPDRRVEEEPDRRVEEGPDRRVEEGPDIRVEEGPHHGGPHVGGWGCERVAVRVGSVHSSIAMETRRRQGHRLDGSLPSLNPLLSLETRRARRPTGHRAPPH